jgi:biotin carboxyl carrier protein
MYNTLIFLLFFPLFGSDVGEYLTVTSYAREELAVFDEKFVALPVHELLLESKRQIVENSPEQSATIPLERLLLAQRSVLPTTPIPARTNSAATVPPLAVSSVTDPHTSFVVQQPRDSNSVRVTGILEVPKRNHVILAAPYQSVLTSLKTEQRDREGRMVTGTDSQPILIPIMEGMQVFRDQVLGGFDDRELQCNLEINECRLDVAIAEREKKIEVEYAAWSYRVAEAELEMLKEANQLHSGAVAKIEINKAMLALRQADANLRLQKYTLDEVKTREVVASEKEVAKIKVLINLRKLIAPIDGTIVRIDKAEGEWLREGDPVLEIMQLDTLRARCKVSAKYYTPDMVEGKAVTVSMPMVNGKMEEFPGKVVFAHPKVEAGDWFEVYIEVENRPSGHSWLLQPGRDVSAVIHL